MVVINWCWLAMVVCWAASCCRNAWISVDVLLVMVETDLSFGGVLSEFGLWGIKSGKSSEDVSIMMAGGEGLDLLRRGPIDRSTAAEGLRFPRRTFR